MHLDNPKKIQWTAHCQNILYNILSVLLNTSDYTWILWIILPTLEIPWMLLENCTKQDMSESVDCQESISHAGPSCWPRNRLKTATDIASWRLVLLERFKIFHFSTISRVSVFFCHVTAWHYQVWPSPNLENLNLSASRLSGFADMCQMFAEFVVGLRVISCDFMGRFQIAHNNPQTPKNTMDIQTVFQIRNCRSFRSVWHQDP